jgi:hypothetical protein
MRVRVAVVAAVCLTAAFADARAQTMPMRSLVDVPTAHTLPRAAYDVGFRIYPEGALTGVNVGLKEWLTVGFAYGGQNVIGYGAPDWNREVGFRVKLNLIEEDLSRPTLSVGYDSQGLGNREDGRYDVKSKGFYAVASKGYDILGPTVLHGGVNFSLEDEDDSDLDFFVGAEKILRPEITLVGEWDAATNDNQPHARSGKGAGFVNLGLRFLFADGLEIQFGFRDVLNNGRRQESGFGREIQVTYVEFF